MVRGDGGGTLRPFSCTILRVIGSGPHGLEFGTQLFDRPSPVPQLAGDISVSRATLSPDEDSKRPILVPLSFSASRAVEKNWSRMVSHHAAPVRKGLALDDVVDLEHLGLAREFDPNVGQYRPQCLAECVELLARIPDLAYSEAPARTERDVVRKPVRRPLGTGRLQALDAFVVLLRSHTGAAAKRARTLVAESGMVVATGGLLRMGCS